MTYEGAKFSREELDILYLPKKLSALEVVAKLRVPSKANIYDRIMIELTPYLKFPISLKGSSEVQYVFLIGPTQSGKTVFLQVIVADAVDQDPGTLTYINPDEKLSKKNMTEKIISMLKLTPDLAKHILHERKMTKDYIELDNMTIFPAWAGSNASISSTPAKTVVWDELRLMKLVMGDESNAIKLGQDRLTTYLSMGLGQGFGASTPSVEGDLLHQQLTVDDTIVVYWTTKCSKCGHSQVLDFFKNKKIITVDGAETYKCACVECGEFFDDSDRKQKINAASFYAPLGSLELPKKLPKRVVCWFTSMNSPFRSFQAIWEEFKATKDKINNYKNFWQCWLAKFWIDDISKTSVERLEECKVRDECGVVPEWTKVITVGIDSQKSGFYVVVRCWGANRITRVIDAYHVDCLLPVSDAKDVEDALRRDVIDQIYSQKDGTHWKAGLIAIDTGGNRTKQIYEGTSSFERFIWVKGAKPTQNITINFNKKLNLYLVRTVEYLEETEEKSDSDTFELASNISTDFISQWVNIRKSRINNKRTGITKIDWKHVGKFDYRMADIHSFICIDIPTSMGTFRRQLNIDDFSFNPIVKRVEAEGKKNLAIQEEEEQSEGSDGYEVGTFTGGW